MVVVAEEDLRGEECWLIGSTLSTARVKRQCNLARRVL